MKKLLIIGAGIGQVHLVKLAKQMGLFVTVVSPKGYPAIEYADELFECDIYDYDRIVEYAKSKHIDAVTSDQNDLMMPTVAYVAEKLGLPGNKYEQVLSYCDKNRFRKVCSEANVPVPSNIRIDNTEIPTAFNCPLPWIIKPANSQSSIGITKIEDKSKYEEAASLALKKSHSHKAILEQFFDGEEYVCEGFVYNGKYHNLSFGDRKYFKNTLIPSQTIFPSSLDEQIKSEIIDCEQRITSSINPSFGIIHSEYKVNLKTRNFCIIESGIRGGGVYISSHLIPLCTGIDINTLLIKCALGEKISIKDYLTPTTNDLSAYMCFTLPEGVISEVSGIDTLSEIEGIEMNDIHNVEVGTRTEKMTVKGARKGPILVHAKNRQELSQIEQKIRETLNIKINHNNKNAIIWE